MNKLLVFAILVVWSTPASAYSLLTHEQLIDLTWKQSIVPLLLSRYPGLTPAQLDQARAYAYGGCVVQDIGYYPFGDSFVSNLTHYVRTGDFVINLFRNSRNANELAFAVGALSHYIGDNTGHHEAVNVSVPVEFPKLREKYGPSVSYAEGKRQHVQTEFAFDIDEIAHHRFAPIHYLRHIGLNVPSRQLSLAFYQTYGITENFAGHRLRRVNVGAYQFAVRKFLPRIAFALTLIHRRHEPADTLDPERVELNRQIDVVSGENQWELYRRKPGIGTYCLAGLLFVLPKVGAIKLAAIKGPTAQTEVLYAHSVLRSEQALRRALARFTPPVSEASHVPGRQLTASPHPLPNRDLDTGGVSKPGSYPLTDSTYAELLHKLTSQRAAPIPPSLKESLMAFYADPSAPISTKKNARRWARVQADLKILADITTNAEPVPFPTYGDDNQ